MKWHDKPSGDLLLRAAGTALLALAWLAGAALRRRAVVGPVDEDALAYLLAAATFLCGSVGASLTLLGRHVFDRIALSRRWRRRDR